MADGPFTLADSGDPEVLEHLCHTHDGFLATLTSMTGLPSMVEQAEQTRSVAASCFTQLDEYMVSHHAVEEEVLFPAVLRNSRTRAERERVAALTLQLTAEHRNIEQLWQKVAPALDAVRSGRPASLDPMLFTRLLRDYTRHVICEETEYLPLARDILGCAAAARMM